MKFPNQDQCTLLDNLYLDHRENSVGPLHSREMKTSSASRFKGHHHLACSLIATLVLYCQTQGYVCLEMGKKLRTDKVRHRLMMPPQCHPRQGLMIYTALPSSPGRGFVSTVTSRSS
ncbi:hypothetical protein RRG08_049166 [Elysia crispata]|uniref:Uncharacterized protein n=1 Tax=Elysia crispata TaxID=231223 RepID=A0AAE1E3B4_9GAST|nr:hypothetical protein RRG08_049166 [Elysia crispata]